MAKSFSIERPEAVTSFTGEIVAVAYHLYHHPALIMLNADFWIAAILSPHFSALE